MAILTAVAQVRDSFAAAISEKFELKVEDVVALWGSEVKAPQGGKTGAPKAPKAALPDNTPPELAKCNKNELVELCKAKGLKHSGTKPDLIARLMGGEVVKPAAKETAKPAKASAASAKAGSKPAPPKKGPSVLNTAPPTLSIRRNKHGNYEHAETGFVFDTKQHKVKGKQEADGSVAPLTEEDIETCDKFKFEYITPDNLDAGADKEDDIVLSGDELVIEGDDDEEEEFEEEADFEEEEEADD